MTNQSRWFGLPLDELIPAAICIGWGKGRNGRVEGTRELVIHPHFVLVYEVDSQWGKVYILRVLHTAQKWP
ncbi:type II toxin-antitoxin system RelE/ParE family toxin [Escherichia coli]|uniref:type II toxin-antitoxin system RelE/ParE family toxin n=1 Tax=Escherichia coli TaxID=562 RepID=UPI001FF40B6B|nr:type II toxin-antitoxin system RelE/ParE family toxin [Escherichia coli]